MIRRPLQQPVKNERNVTLPGLIDCVVPAGNKTDQLMLNVIRTTIARTALIMAVLVLAAGCATKKPVQKEFAFFPPAPDQPRIQFLLGFAKEADIGGGGASFKDFVVGSDKFTRPIYKPYGITSTKGKIYVCDSQGMLVNVIDLSKKRMHSIRPEGKGSLALPINVAADPDGTCYVTDTKQMKVFIYDKSGDFKAEIGNGTDMKPCGIAVRGQNLYVTDITNHCVKVFNKSTREFLFQIPRSTDEKARLFSPSNITIGQDGKIYVSDSGGFRIQVYDAEGNHVRFIGEMGLEPGKFALPKGIGVDREGRIYVVDAATQLVQLFDPEGRLLMYFGYPEGKRPGALYLPAGLAIDYENVDAFQKYVAPGYRIDFLIFVVNQVGPNKVGVYGFLRKA
jgi:DNA-binding beta-propeller fold protein YncE